MWTDTRAGVHGQRPSSPFCSCVRKQQWLREELCGQQWANPPPDGDRAVVKCSPNPQPTRQTSKPRRSRRRGVGAGSGLGSDPHRSFWAAGAALPSAGRPHLESWSCFSSRRAERMPSFLSSSTRSPFWCICSRMSQPPTNSPLRYTCGMVGQLE